jgi:delta(3,5)-delta(2,4)-dienoyl-CoA isomerase
MNATSDQSNDLARKAKVLRQVVDRWQAAVSSIEECCKPVIVCVHGGCIGAGVDIITACDIRLCDSEAFCSIKEVDIGLAADLGTLQRLTKVIGSQSVVRELCYRANSISSKEMLGIGLVSGTYDNRDRMKEHALKLAKEISVKSPVAVQMTKRALVHALNNPTNSSLDYIANYNMFLLQSQDLMESISAKIEKRKPVYSKL